MTTMHDAVSNRADDAEWAADIPRQRQVTATPTVALVDDHELVAQVLQSALFNVGVACSTVAPQPVEPLLESLLQAAPDLVLLDLDLGDVGSSLPLIAPLADADIKVLILTGSADRIRQAEALEQGAIGVVTKSADFAALVAAVRDAAVHSGVRTDPRARALLGELAAHRARLAADRAPYDRLTDREKETLTALARGHAVQQIAAAWTVSETTVRSHVRAILHKLDARSQLQAVVRAVHAGWIDPDDAAIAGD